MSLVKDDSDYFSTKEVKLCVHSKTAQILFLYKRGATTSTVKNCTNFLIAQKGGTLSTVTDSTEVLLPQKQSSNVYSLGWYLFFCRTKRLKNNACSQ